MAVKKGPPRTNVVPPKGPRKVRAAADKAMTTKEKLENNKQMKAIGDISSVNRSIYEMQKNIKKETEKIKKSGKAPKEYAAVQTALARSINKLGDVTNALAHGVQTITIDTAKASKDVVKQYGQAISEEVSFNKENMVTMALARTSPLVGYFAAKLMKTEVFQKAKDRMKESVSKSLSSAINIFKIRRNREKDIFEKETAAFEDYTPVEVKAREVTGKGRVAKPVGIGGVGGGLEAKAEEVRTRGAIREISTLGGGFQELVSEVTSRLDRIISINEQILQASSEAAEKTPDESDFEKKLASFAIMSDKDKKTFAEAQGDELSKKFDLFQKEKKKEAKLSPEAQQLKVLLSIQKALGASTSALGEVFSSFIYKHPMLRTFFATVEALGVAGKFIVSGFGIPGFVFRGRGGYARDLSKKKSPFVALNENMGTFYVETMWRMDNILNLMKASTVATRDMASTITGIKYGPVRGVGTGIWSIGEVAGRAVGLTAGLGVRALGAGVEKLTGYKGISKAGSGMLRFFGQPTRGWEEGSIRGGGIGAARTEIEEAEKKRVGVFGRTKGWLLGEKEEERDRFTRSGALMPGQRKQALLVQDITIGSVSKQFKKVFRFMSKKLPDEQKNLKLIARSTSAQSKAITQIRKGLKRSRMMKWILWIFGFLKTGLGLILGPIKTAISGAISGAVGGLLGGGGLAGAISTALSSPVVIAAIGGLAATFGIKKFSEWFEARENKKKAEDEKKNLAKASGALQGLQRAAEAGDMKAAVAAEKMKQMSATGLGMSKTGMV